jgi:hypothetical protein
MMLRSVEAVNKGKLNRGEPFHSSRKEEEEAATAA